MSRYPLLQVLFLSALIFYSAHYFGATLPRLLGSGQLTQLGALSDHGAIPTVKQNAISRADTLQNQLLVAFAESKPVANLVDLSSRRKEAMLQLASLSPRDFLRLALDRQTRDQLPEAVRANVESEAKVTGKLEIMHGDPLPDQPLIFSYALANKQGLYHLTTTATLPADYEGAEIEVSGIQLGQTIVVNSTSRSNLNLLQAPTGSNSNITTATGPRRLLVIPISFTDSPAHPFTREQVQPLIFSGQLQNFFNEDSYGRVSLTGDVLDWLDLPRAHTSEVMYSQVTVNTPEVVTHLTNNHINLANYDVVTFLINHSFEAFGYGEIGSTPDRPKQAWVSSTNDPNYGFNVSSVYTKPSPFSWTNLDNELAHELGHTFAIHHADGLDCGNEIANGACQHVEYGSGFDIMGQRAMTGGGITLNKNIYLKEQSGYLLNGELLNISQSGQYTINPLEAAAGIKGAKVVSVGLGRTLYLEYRRSLGFDSKLSTQSNYTSNQNGLMINRVIQTSDNLPGADSYYFPAPRLLDLSPSSAAWNSDSNAVTLNGNQIFTDPETGVTIGPIISATPEEIVFNVTMPTQCQ